MSECFTFYIHHFMTFDHLLYIYLMESMSLPLPTPDPEGPVCAYINFDLVGISPQKWILKLTVQTCCIV